MKNIEALDCVELLSPFMEKFECDPKVQLIGGIGSVALLDKNTVIDADKKRVLAPDDLFVPNFRANGTRRDADVLVLTRDQAKIGEVKNNLMQTVGSELEISVFGFQSSNKLDKLIDRPLGMLAFKQFLSDRYSDQNEQELVKSLFPFVAPIKPESLEPWSLTIGSRAKVNIPNPATSLVNYLSRSIDGVRKKDTKKVGQLANRFTEVAPELMDEIRYGAASSQFELALLIHSAGVGMEPLSKAIGYELTAQDKAEMLDHPYFMGANWPDSTKRAVMAEFKFKAKGVRTLSSADKIVEFWQKHIETRISSITGIQ